MWRNLPESGGRLKTKVTSWIRVLAADMQRPAAPRREVTRSGTLLSPVLCLVSLPAKTNTVWHNKDAMQEQKVIRGLIRASDAAAPPPLLHKFASHFKQIMIIICGGARRGRRDAIVQLSSQVQWMKTEKQTELIGGSRRIMSPLTPTYCFRSKCDSLSLKFDDVPLKSPEINKKENN